MQGIRCSAFQKSTQVSGTVATVAIVRDLTQSSDQPLKREKIIDEVEQFFNSYSFRRMAALNPTEFYAKEEMVLSWADQQLISWRSAKRRRLDKVERRRWYAQLQFSRYLLEELQQLFVKIQQMAQAQVFEIRSFADKEKICWIVQLPGMKETRDLENQVNARFDEHDRAYRALLTNIRKDMHDHKTALSLDVVKSHQKLSTQVAAAALDNVNVLKEVKEQRAILDDMDESLATVRSELFDFRAQAQKNHNNLSIQLGFLVDYINRGVMPKWGSGSSRPQPPPDDQARPSGGSASREGGNSGGRGSESSSGSKRRRGYGGGSRDRQRSSGGGSGSGHVTYGPYLPPKRSAKYWVYGEKEF
ncbi:hypothetical protein F511_15605 [Dorcoceras hygrometricum]|uniref:Uncharacterized protein n=1 Tax=Dorcoceras hygrometricum TaxID=472368 RepID=A0A2Z7B411_9LAMI|nr:hypothetical protein F511_15605 [Dorcoceras hygrometricum]